MKKLFAIIIIPFFLVSCTTTDGNDRFFCKKLGFDKEDGKIYVTAQLASSGKSTPESGKEKIITRVADNADKAIGTLEREFDNILFKPLECVVFGQGVDTETVRKIVVLMANRVEFQLKCDVFFAPSAKEALSNKNGADENEGVSFSHFFRNMTGGTNDGKE